MSDKLHTTSSKAAMREMKDEYLRMLEESFQNTAEIKKGDVIEAPIVSISDQYLILNLGGKYDAYAEIGEFSNANGVLAYKVGDNLKGYVVDQNENGYVIAKSLTKQYVDKQSILEAYEKKIPVQGKIFTPTKGGFNVDILGAKAFCPVSQVSLKSSEDTAQYIGKTMDFLVIECSENCRRIVVSHRQLEEMQEQERKEAALAKLNAGDVVKGKVLRMTTFGAFVDLDGIEGLLHISEISWQHIVKPQDELKKGQEIEVKILDIKGEKIALSRKALLENPFDQALKELHEGDIINCRVLRLHNFGAFAELKPGVEGLIPVSEMSRNRQISHPREVVKEGDWVQVQILRIDENTHKISLSLKALEADPWDKIDEIVQLENPFEGIVESSTNFGVFVTISEGITGLLPKSRVRKSDSFQTGDPITLMVTAIDKDNHRITLDYTDRSPLEIAEERARSEEHNHREQHNERTHSSNQRRGGRNRNDEDWRKYASQKVNPVTDNPFKDL
ncbi:MAG: 30S ribosomal protein S1 [Candidatus Cloacimonetes bacterium ADurb.Bin089]|jgi:small subunit ribosomal protein S1|nr:MAG: 30S ribosomal protein S1 [Candidatus Cloacimonetes bacterium ADurb.Bin089]